MRTARSSHVSAHGLMAHLSNHMLGCSCWMATISHMSSVPMSWPKLPLFSLCAAHGLSTCGTKAIMRERILRKQDHIEGPRKQCSKGTGRGVTALEVTRSARPGRNSHRNHRGER